MYQMPDHRDRAPAKDRDLDSRVVVDRQGNEWVIHEVETPQAWAHGKKCLIFSSSSIVRRVWQFPSDWARLSSAELLELVGDAAPPL